jgi:hypothetical protein
MGVSDNSTHLKNNNISRLWLVFDSPRLHQSLRATDGGPTSINEIESTLPPILLKNRSFQNKCLAVLHLYQLV